MTSNVNIINVLEVSPLDLSMWLSTNILDLRIPKPGPNHTLNIEIEILPLMAEVANRELLCTELYITVVGATPTQTSIRTSEIKDMKENAEQMGRRKDILYRTLQALEASRETLSRMMHGNRVQYQPR